MCIYVYIYPPLPLTLFAEESSAFIFVSSKEFCFVYFEELVTGFFSLFSAVFMNWQTKGEFQLLELQSCWQTFYILTAEWVCLLEL